MTPLTILNQQIIQCERCPRLREHCRRVAEQKRASFMDWDYWGKPVSNLGQLDGKARMLIVGLAPAAHGANRTGRMFTGDRSGDFLFRALHQTGFANQPHATDINDGLVLHDTLITAICHCAPPDNKPTSAERRNCSGWLEQTYDAMPHLRVVVCLGGMGFDAMLSLYQQRGWIKHKAPHRFAHGSEHPFPPPAMPILCTYHPSQQNTFTGRLTEAMLRKVFEQAQRYL